MKKWLAYTFAASAVLGLIVHHIQHASASTNPSPSSSALQTAHYLEKSFTATHATVRGYEIHNWSSFPTTSLSMNELSRQALRFTQDFPMQNTKIYKYATANELYYEVTGNGPDHTHVTATLSSFHNASAADSSLFILRVDGQTNHLTHFESMLKQVETAVSGMQVLPQISACIEGTTNAKIIGDSANNLVAKALTAVDAHVVEGLHSNLVTSVSGYSPESSTVILTNGHKMNLQVAVHYDSVHHRTNVLVGTPIITVTY